VFAMHYDIRLPRDYDMGTVRHRVATRGHALDDLPGLGLKAYLVRDVAAGAPVSSYSPLYLWTDEAAAARFLWGGGGFSGIVRDFSRPRVQTWLGGSFRCDGTAAAPVRAVVQHRDVATGAVLEEVAEQAAHLTSAMAADPATWAAAHLLDPQTWRLTHLVLTAASGPVEDLGLPLDPATSTEDFEVLHLSTPGVADLVAA
jgi:hypothetical protein